MLCTVYEFFLKRFVQMKIKRTNNLEERGEESKEESKKKNKRESKEESEVVN